MVQWQCLVTFLSRSDLLERKSCGAEIGAVEARQQAGYDVLILVVAVGLRHAKLAMLTSTTTWVVNAMRTANKSPVRPDDKTPPMHAAVSTGLDGHKRACAPRIRT